MDMKIPFYKPFVDRREIEAVERVFLSGHLTQGREVEAFEREAAEFLGVPAGFEAVAVSNCTAGLYLLMKGMDVGQGDRVCVPDVTFAATINAVLAAGAMPCIMDGNPLIGYRDKIPFSNGIIDVCYAGDMSQMMGEIKAEWIIQDKAHAFQPGAGNIKGDGAAGAAFSFFPTKNITAGEGGMVVALSSLAQTIRQMRDHGRSSTYEIAHPGSLNFRMSDIQAAILREQIKKWPEIEAGKKRALNAYEAAGINSVAIPDTWLHFYPMICKEHQKDRVFKSLAAHGVQASCHFRPLSDFAKFEDFIYMADFKYHGREFWEREISLPMWPNMCEADIETVIQAVKEAK